MAAAGPSRVVCAVKSMVRDRVDHPTPTFKYYIVHIHEDKIENHTWVADSTLLLDAKSDVMGISVLPEYDFNLRPWVIGREE